MKKFSPHLGTFALMWLIAISANAQWQRTTMPNNVSAINSLVTNGSAVFAGTGLDAVFYSLDNGTHWNNPGSGIGHYYIYSMAINGSYLYAATSAAGVFLSKDSARTWTAVNTGISDYIIQALAVSGTHVYAGANNYTMNVSADSGAQWTLCDNGLGPQGQSVWALAGNAATIFAGTTRGVLVSTNNGGNWTQSNSGLGGDTSVIALLINGQQMFASTYSSSNSVYESSDLGATWHLATTGLPDFPIYSFALSGSTVFAASWGGGVFYTIDSGANWIAFNDGLTDLIVNAVAANDEYIFAGNADSSNVWRRPIADVLSVQNANPDYNIRLYPNPGTGLFRMETGEVLPFSASVFNSLGQRVMQSTFTGGSLDIDLSEYAAGIYFVSVQSGDRCVTKKLVKEGN